jgi:hypothetical protein
LWRDGGEETPPFLFVVPNSELVFSLALGLTETAMLTNLNESE